MSSSASSSSSGVPPTIASPLFKLHHFARTDNPAYPKRQPVPDDKVHWSVEWKEYAPKDFTSEGAAKKPVLSRSKDPPDCHKIPNLASRFSYHPLTLSPESNRPLNPFGRTGLQGRGKLYNWGPNHAADPILSRPSSSHPGELEVIVIQRGDGGKWAFSGGMVDEGEQPQETLKREFSEEALNVREEDKEKAREVHKKVFAGKGELIYHGYIDDPRNTDNAWIESYAMHFHLSPSVAAELTPLLRAGDDAKDVKWLLASEDNPEMQKLYGSHRPILQMAVRKWKESNKAEK